VKKFESLIVSNRLRAFQRVTGRSNGKEMKMFKGEFKSSRRRLSGVVRDREARENREREDAERRARSVRDSNDVENGRRASLCLSTVNESFAFSNVNVTAEIDRIMRIFESIKAEVGSPGEAARVFGQRHPRDVEILRAATCQLATQSPMALAASQDGGQRGTLNDVKAFDLLVEQDHRQRGGSIADSIVRVGREHRELAERRIRALSLPLTGAVALVDR
jgi:hypothetical protein